VRPKRASGGEPELIIDVQGLRKSFGTVEALRGVDFSVSEGKVLGLLGPNGAGKTTAVRILTTLLQPTGGQATVCGYDVVRHAAAVRRVIGLAGQATAITPDLTGYENLEMAGRLYHLGKVTSRQRTTELLERFELTDAAKRPAKTYSGGMLRRLDLAASLIGQPRVLFLDEPTTGLDPVGRFGMWAIIRELVTQGATLLLTTQYLEEADELADNIIVIDHGQVIASGTAEELKDRIGGDVVEFSVTDRSKLDAALQAVAVLGQSPPTADAHAGLVQVHAGDQGSQLLVEAVRALDAAGIHTTGLGVRRPSLDDVFVSLTGHGAEQVDDTDGAGGNGSARHGSGRQGSGRHGSARDGSASRGAGSGGRRRGR
jgi:ABC-2 type transport system ATP-binding protein